jgi:hypothetical protein
LGGIDGEDSSYPSHEEEKAVVVVGINLLFTLLCFLYYETYFGTNKLKD